MWIIAYKSNPKRLLWDFTQPTQPVVATKQGVRESPSSTPAKQVPVPVATTTETRMPATRAALNEKGKSLGSLAVEDDNRFILIPPGKDGAFEEVLDAKRYIRGIGIKTAGGLYYWLNGLYLDGDYIYMSVTIYNTSQISYDVDFVGFEHMTEVTITRKKQTTQDDVVSPPFYYSYRSIPIGEEKKLIYAIPLYAYNEGDQMALKIVEKKGDRSLFLKFSGKDLLSAKRISNQ